MVKINDFCKFAIVWIGDRRVTVDIDCNKYRYTIRDKSDGERRFTEIVLDAFSRYCDYRSWEIIARDYIPQIHAHIVVASYRGAIESAVGDELIRNFKRNIGFFAF